MVEVALVVALGGALLLGAAGVAHVREPGALRTALTLQQLVAARWRPVVAAGTGPVEIVAGAAVIGCWFAAPGSVRWPLLATGAGYTVLAAYGGVVRVRRQSAPCGCFGAGEPISWLVVGRAAAFAVASVVAALTHATGPSLADRCWSLGLAALVAVAAWLGPELATLSSGLSSTRGVE